MTETDRFAHSDSVPPVRVRVRRSFNYATVNPFTSMKLLCSTRLMIQLAAVVFFSYLPEAGEYQVRCAPIALAVAWSERVIVGTHIHTSTSASVRFATDLTFPFPNH
jgi:hypothetical protein